MQWYSRRNAGNIYPEISGNLQINADFINEQGSWEQRCSYDTQKLNLDARYQRLMEDIQYTGRAANPDHGFPKLIKTLVPSPVIKDIFEANLRSPDSQDIIFIKVYPKLSVG